MLLDFVSPWFRSNTALLCYQKASLLMIRTLSHSEVWEIVHKISLRPRYTPQIFKYAWSSVCRRAGIFSFLCRPLFTHIVIGHRWASMEAQIFYCWLILYAQNLMVFVRAKINQMVFWGTKSDKRHNQSPFNRWALHLGRRKRESENENLPHMAAFIRVLGKPMKDLILPVLSDLMFHWDTVFVSEMI